ncbi:MAG: ribosome silencing factor [bacterium]|nr:ribosome silencing factor [bacterium]
MSPKKVAQSIANTLQAKKAEDIVIMNLAKVTDITNYFVVCTASSEIHSKALARSIEEKIGSPWHLEGYSHGYWILLDYLDVVVHIFLREARDYYGLERIWGDVPTIRIDTNIS